MVYLETGWLPDFLIDRIDAECQLLPSPGSSPIANIVASERFLDGGIATDFFDI